MNTSPLYSPPNPEPAVTVEVPPVGAVVVEDGEYLADVGAYRTQWALCWCEDGRHQTDRDPWDDHRPARVLSGSHTAQIVWYGVTSQDQRGEAVGLI